MVITISSLALVELLQERIVVQSLPQVLSEPAPVFRPIFGDYVFIIKKKINFSFFKPIDLLIVA